MSMAAISSGRAAPATPKGGDCAGRARSPVAIAPQKHARAMVTRLAVAIRDCPVAGDLPDLNRVVVILGVHPAYRDELGQRGLLVPGLVHALRGEQRVA